MAEFRWAQGSIGGVSLTFNGDPCRAYILDGANLRVGKRYVNQRLAADGTVYTQGFDRGGRGARFGVKIDNVPISILAAIETVVVAAVDSQTSFLVELQDDWQSVAAQCTVDGSEWLKYDSGVITNAQFVANVTLRFITV